MDEKQLLETLPLNFFQSLYNAVVITTARLDGDHPKILYVNPAFTDMTGYAVEEIVGKTPRILQGELTDRAVLDELKEDLLSGKPFEGETFNYHKNGSVYRVRWNIEPLKNNNDETVAYISCQKDVSIEYNLLQHRKLFQKAIDQSSIHVALFDSEAHLIYANDAFVKRTGYTLDVLMGKQPNLLKSGLHDAAFYDELREHVAEGTSFTALFTNRNAEGALYHEKQTITPIIESGTLIGYVLFGKDYDKEFNERNELISESLTDDLTGLFNRKALAKELKFAIDDYHNLQQPFCLFFADLDSFKGVNDRFGHDAGDKALHSIASILRNNLRKSDKLFRYGGDEFICLLHDMHSDQAASVADKLQGIIASDPVATRYGIGISIGIVEYAGESPEELLRRADTAMYRNKPAKHRN